MLCCDPTVISAVTDSHLALGSVSYIGYCCSFSPEGKKKPACLGKQENEIFWQRDKSINPSFNLNVTCIEHGFSSIPCHIIAEEE